MSLNDYKIREADYTGKDVASLPDEPSEAGMSAAELKAAFDKLGKEVIVPKHNAFVDASVGTGGAGNTGAEEIESGSGQTVQSNLEYLLGKLNIHLAAPAHIAYSAEIPMPQQPAARNPAAFFSFTPPTAMSGMWESGALIALI